MERRLSDLKGEIVSINGRPTQDDCLFFLCPCCDGGHGIMVSWDHPPLYKNGVIWRKKGETIEDLTLSPSIDCTQPILDDEGKIHPNECSFHGWVKNGTVSW